jgi:rubrerythrin
MSAPVEFDLAAIDVDGAVREAEARLSRGRFFAGALALAGGLAVARPARALALSARDQDVLSYALGLERLQAAFYTEAERVGALKGESATAAARLGGVERAHVKAFEGLLGSRAGTAPAFDFRGTTESGDDFLKTAVALEDLAVAAYKGQAPRLYDNTKVLAAAIGIHTVEARHAAWMRRLVGITPAASAFDKPADRASVDRIVASTRFIVAKRPSTGRTGSPSFTG